MITECCIGSTWYLSLSSKVCKGRLVGMQLAAVIEKSSALRVPAIELRVVAAMNPVEEPK